jgi:hypothetical protein
VGMPFNRARGLSVDRTRLIWAVPTIFNSTTEIVLHKIDPSSGSSVTATPIPYPVNSEVSSLDINRSGSFLSVQLGSNVPGGGPTSVLELDPFAGMIDSTTVLVGAGSINGLARSPSNTLFALDASGDRLIALDPTTGLVTFTGPGQNSVFGAGVGLAYSNGQLYTSNVTRQGAAQNELVVWDS